MATLDLRGSRSTLRLARNGSAATVRSFLVAGPQGPQGPQGAQGPQGPQGIPGSGAGGGLSIVDNGDGTATLTASGTSTITDNNDGTATIAG